MVSVAVRAAVVVVGKVGGIARGLADELRSIPATTPAIRCMSSGASRGWLLEWNDSVDSSPLGPGATLSSSDIGNTHIIKDRAQNKTAFNLMVSRQNVRVLWQLPSLICVYSGPDLCCLLMPYIFMLTPAYSPVKEFH